MSGQEILLYIHCSFYAISVIRQGQMGGYLCGGVTGVQAEHLHWDWPWDDVTSFTVGASNG